MRSRAIARPTPLPKEQEVPDVWHCIQGQAVAPYEVTPASIAVASILRIAFPAADGFVCAACGRGRCVETAALVIA